MEDNEADNLVSTPLINDDGENRRIVGALLSVFASEDAVSSAQGIWGFLTSQQPLLDDVIQGLQTQATTADRRAADPTRAGPFMVAQTTGTNDVGKGVQVATDLGHPDNWIPWPDGAEMHVACLARAADDSGGRAVGLLFYQEGAAGGTL